MTRLLIILISTIGFLNPAKADTIDYWHVYYNKTKIKDYNQYSNGVITIKIKDIKKTDYLTVKYFRDTPCDNCETQVTIENEKHIVVVKGKGVGTFKPIKVSVFDILQYHLKANNNIYDVFYQEASRTQKTIIFRIKLE